MDFLFGKRKDPDELLRERGAEILRQIREAELEVTRLQCEYNKLRSELEDIKQPEMCATEAMIAAKQGQIDAVRMQIERANVHLVLLQGTSAALKSVRQNQQLEKTIRGATGTLATINSAVHPLETQVTMLDYDVQRKLIDHKAAITERVIQGGLRPPAPAAAAAAAREENRAEHFRRIVMEAEEELGEDNSLTERFLRLTK